MSYGNMSNASAEAYTVRLDHYADFTYSTTNSEV
jgi:hypothetical protein